MTSKYFGLSDHLAAIGAAMITLTFAEIEAVIGPLPAAAWRGDAKGCPDTSPIVVGVGGVWPRRGGEEQGMCGASLARPCRRCSRPHHGVSSAGVSGWRRADTKSGGLGRPATGGRKGDGACGVTPSAPRAGRGWMAGATGYREALANRP